MPLNLMILTSYFALELNSIKGGVGYRYVGLYGSLVKTLLKKSSESKVFWYSHNDQSLRIITQGEYKRMKKNMLEAIIHIISDTFENKSHLVVIIGYPYAVPRIRRILEYISSLLIMKIFSIMGRIRILVDDFDPPVEGARAFHVKPSLWMITYARIMEMFTLKLSTFIITVSEFWKKYMAKIYHLREDKIFVVSNGSLVRHINYNLKKPKHPFTILYAGSAMKVKGIDKLVSSVAKLRERRLNIELYIAGAKLMDLPSWVHVAHYDWPSFVNSILLKSDVCVIPYPPERFGFFLPAKLFDYMAAGKPIVSTSLKEVAHIIRTYNCGFVARDWDEFGVYLERLYKDRALGKNLGNNGRKAAEKYFNYELLAEELLSKLIEMFMAERK